MTQVQFGTGQTEAFLTMISERALGQHLPLPPSGCRDPAYVLVQKKIKTGEENDHLGKQRQGAIPGREGLLKKLLNWHNTKNESK